VCLPETGGRSWGLGNFILQRRLYSLSPRFAMETRLGFLVAEVATLTNVPVDTPEGAREALKDAMLSTHPDKQPAGLSEAEAAQVTNRFIAIKKCHDSLVSAVGSAGGGAAAGDTGEEASVALPVHVSLETLRSGGTVRMTVVVGTPPAFETIDVEVPPGALPPLVVPTATERYAKLLDEPDLTATHDARRKPYTLHITAKVVLPDNAALLAGHTVAVDTRLVPEGRIVVELPPFSAIMNVASNPFVVFSGGGIVGAHGTRGDLIVYVTVSPDVGLLMDTCIDLHAAMGDRQAAQRLREERDALREELRQERKKVNFLTEAMLEPDDRRSSRLRPRVA
jgi:hypothetical protein